MPVFDADVVQRGKGLLAGGVHTVLRFLDALGADLHQLADAITEAEGRTSRRAPRISGRRASGGGPTAES